MNRMKKKYQQLFARYNVHLRQANSKVYHPAYHTWTEVTPLQFALYETAIKAIDAHYQALIRIRYVPQGAKNVVNIVISPKGSSTPASDAEWLASYERARQWHAEIAKQDNFELEEVKVSPDVAYADYRYCCRELGPLYHDLLD